MSATPEPTAPTPSEPAAPPEGATAPGGAAAPPARHTRRRVLLGAACAAAVAATGGYFARRALAPRDDLGRLQGTWALAPDGHGTRFPVTVRVTGDRWVYLVGGQEQKRYALTLRPDADPKEIDLTQLGPGDQPSAFVLRGIYVIEGDGVRVVVAPSPQPRPTGFYPTDGPPVWVLERP